MARMRLCAAAALASLWLAGCIAFTFTRTHVHAPIDDGRLAGLEPGRSSFGDALAALGAPTDAWPLPGDARALAWGWSDQRADGVNIQIPLSRRVAPNLALDQGRDEFVGVVLFFDADDVLTDIRRGYLRTLEPAARTPDDVEATEPSSRP